jgi:phage major head subunit gpT-like protein
MAVAVTGGFSQLLTKDFEKVSFDNYMGYMSLYDQVAKTETYSQNSVKEGEMASFGAFSEKAEGQAADQEIPKQGNSKTVYFKEYEKIFQITQVMYEDDLTGNMRQMPAQLGKAAAYTRDVEFFDLFNNGFVSTYHTALDGLPIFNDSHTYIDYAGQTYSNQSTLSLSETSFRAAVDYFKKHKNHKGVPIPLKPKVLIIPPDLEWTAKELLLSEYRPYTSDNEINASSSSQTGVSYLVVPNLTSTTAWFLMADEHDMRFMWRRKYKFQGWDDPNTGNALFKGSMRFAVACYHPEFGFGSSGA